MPQFKSINFCCNRPKIKLFLQKKLQNLRALGLRPQTPLPPAVGNVAPTPPMVSCGRDCSYLIDNSFVVSFYCLFSTLALVKCSIVWQYFCNVGGIITVRTALKVPLEKAAFPCPFDVPAPLTFSKRVFIFCFFVLHVRIHVKLLVMSLKYWIYDQPENCGPLLRSITDLLSAGTC